MGKLVWILFLTFCLLLAVDAKKKGTQEAAKEEEVPKEDNAKAEETQDEEPKEEEEEDSAKATDDDSAKSEAKEEDSADAKDMEGKEEEAPEDEAATVEESEDEQAPEMACNLKFKRVGCYSDKSKKEKPLRSYIMSDADMGTISKKGKLPSGDKFNSELPKFACKCANEAINGGNAIFGIQNLAECWTGPDDSKYDKDGQSEDCVTFDYAPCDDNSEMCAGKKHANFVYYVDTPEHTKSKEEVAKEYVAYKKKVTAYRKKEAKKKAAKKLKKKAKKAKKE